MLVPSIALAELILRGSLIYLGIFALMRFVLKREAGAIGLPDILMTVLIADAAQNAMAADYVSITDGLFLVGTLLLWSMVISWLSLRVPLVRRFVMSPPVPLVLNGRILTGNLRRELMSRANLQSKLREQGVDDVSQVKEAWLEPNGEISVIKSP